ncbi:hypothetical protein BDU57DRAFT_198540 [Ampelomyces quisqualis]|uniref:Uncharacterized protein n=1 Tax=Ampelomyces quisqualis TaxID=50730 RepID=A0A6A5QRW6_AMPQU|nr:hypothetical protein BDU57DRAFT_198540 [Ampelomyces quisqualis]
MSAKTIPTFVSNMSHALQIVECLLRWQRGSSKNRRLHVYYRAARIYDITLHERDLQLYYEGLILRDHHGDAFDRNLATERPEQERRC